MTVFDKLCAAVAFILGLLFLVLGAMGLFIGCKANFSLGPVFGVIPAFVGWGIVRPIYLAWKQSQRPDTVPHTRRWSEDESTT
jgi:hypothetical protein